MKIKKSLTALLIITTIAGAKAQTAAERKVQIDSLVRIGKAECFMLKSDIKAYLEKVGASHDSLKAAHLEFITTAFPFLKNQIKSISDLNKLCNDPLLRNEFISIAQDVIVDYWKRKAVIVELRHLSE